MVLFIGMVVKKSYMLPQGRKGRFTWEQYIMH